MSPNRGLWSTILTLAVMSAVLVSLFGCSNDDDLSAPQETFGTIEITMPAEEIGATWHLYGPGDSFRHGDSATVLPGMRTGQYTIIWTAVKNWTAPAPARHSLGAGRTLALHGEYLDKAPADKFVLVNGGSFIMGSEDGSRYTEPDSNRIPAEKGRDQDEDLHHVGLNNNFYLGKTEITNQEFVELGNWALSQDPPLATTTATSMLDALDGSTVELINFDFTDTPIDVQDGMLRLKKPEDAARPVIELTWYGAVSFCDWLSLQEGLERAYNHDDWTVGGGDFYTAGGYRLPTEAEWEYACRAGTRTAFWSGDIVDGSCDPKIESAILEAGWSCVDKVNTSQAVGGKAANQWGLFDMHGNVWEWCHDYYGRYEVPEPDPDDPDQIIYVIDPTGPEEGELRCVRGGRWLLSPTLCRSAGRMMAMPDFRGINIGLRVAQTDIP